MNYFFAILNVFKLKTGFQSIHHTSRTIKEIETLHAIYIQKHTMNYRDYSKSHEFHIPNGACFVYLKTLHQNLLKAFSYVEISSLYF